MPPRKHVAKRRQKRQLRIFLLLLVFVLILAAIVTGVVYLIGALGRGAQGATVAETTTTTGLKEPQVVSTATVGSSGDILIHTPVLRTVKVSSGVYDFAPIFQYVKPYVSKLDYSAINLEFGIGRGESDYWQKEMIFRLPSSLIDAVQDAGYTLGLCANNHVTNGNSLSLTEGTLTEKGMDHIGLRASSAVKPYLVKEINGISLGFINYTYGAKTGASTMVNYFSTKELEAFYSDLQTQMTAMKAEGAKKIIVYMHWGIEYQIAPSSSQTTMAKKLCEMGVDVIIGGHPHKIQPLELIAADNGNKTVCLYSMGNFVSNQTIEAMYGGSASNSRNFQDGGVCSIPDVSNRYADTRWDQHDKNCNDNGHTEDGLVFELSFAKYEDGSVFLSSVNTLPTWCYRSKDSSGKYQYRIIPLDKSVQDWGSAFSIADIDKPFAERSYNRTMELVGNGMTTINADCAAEIAQFKENYKQAQTATTVLQ